MDALRGDTAEKRSQYNEIVYGSDAQTGSKVDLVEKAEKNPKPKWEDVKKAFENKEYGKGIKLFFKMFFTSLWFSDGKTGLSHFIELKDQIPMSQVCGLIQQFEQADPASQTLRDKLLAGIVSGELRRMFHKEYKPLSEQTKSEELVPKDIEAGTKLESIVDPKIWQRMQEKEDCRGQKRDKIVGIIRYEKPLPKGRIFFTKEGFPVWFSYQPIPSKDVPPVTIYEHKGEKNVVDKSHDEEMVEALEATLQPGDILLTSRHIYQGKDGSNIDTKGRLFRRSILIKNGQEHQEAGDTFSHALFYDGKNIEHMNEKWETGTPKEVFLESGKLNRYKAVTVLRLPKPLREDLQQKIQERVNVYKSNPKLRYGTKLWGMAGNWARGQKKYVNDNDPDTCICTDPIYESMHALGDEADQKRKATQDPAEQNKQTARMKLLEDMMDDNAPSALIGKHVQVVASFEFNRDH